MDSFPLLHLIVCIFTFPILFTSFNPNVPLFCDRIFFKRSNFSLYFTSQSLHRVLVVVHTFFLPNYYFLITYTCFSYRNGHLCYILQINKLLLLLNFVRELSSPFVFYFLCVHACLRF